MNFIRELKNFLAGRAENYRARRQFGPVLDFEVAEEIAADAQAQQKAMAGDGYAAEQADLEAAKLISAVLAEGVANPQEAEALRRAQRLIQQSAEKDRAITEMAMA